MDTLLAAALMSDLDEVRGLDTPSDPGAQARVDGGGGWLQVGFPIPAAASGSS